MKSCAALFAILVCVSGGGAAAQDAKTKAAAPGAAVDLHGKLYRSVFSAGADALTAADVERLPEALRARLTTYLSRRAAFKSQYAHASDTLEVMRTDAKKRAVERAIVSLLDVPGIEKLAVDFVTRAPIAYEWHGLHDAPLAEAAYAEGVLKGDPNSPLVPFLYVFIAHRQRVAFEAFEAAKDEEGMKTSARRYRAFAERARAVEDPLFGALMTDIDALPYVYLKATAHPRDYDAR